jgi:hypothetical protein
LGKVYLVMQLCVIPPQRQSISRPFDLLAGVAPINMGGHQARPYPLIHPKPISNLSIAGPLAPSCTTGYAANSEI